jgi:DNA-binding MarR family transcriptional regulator
LPFCNLPGERARVAKPSPLVSIDPSGEFPLDLTTYVFHLLAVVSRHREAKLDAALHTLDLSLSRYRALSVIATFDTCTMSALADYTAVDRTTLTRTVDSLVAAGLVERVTPKEDRRQVLLRLTPGGRTVFRKAIQTIFRLNRSLLADLTDDDQRALVRGLESFLARLIDEKALLQRLLLRHGQG